MGSVRMECAPIIIPTMNRVEHLKRCVDSLKKNNWAKYTELYISIDYPLEQKHMEGYEEIKDYVFNGIDGFKNVQHFVQTKNLGPYANMRFLVDEVYKKYDRFIFTEDDNVFSPSVIEYWNKGLEQYKYDDKIIAICAKSFARYLSKDKDNVYACATFCAYGYAIWRDKDEELQKRINVEMIRNIFNNRKVLRNIAFGDLGLYQALLEVAYEKKYTHFIGETKLFATDYMVTLYIKLYNKVCLFPCVQMVINEGYDGSGANCHNNGNMQRNLYKLSPEEHFEYMIQDELEEKVPIVTSRRVFSINRIILHVETILFLVFGKKWYKFLKRR